MRIRNAIFDLRFRRRCVLGLFGLILVTLFTALRGGNSNELVGTTQSVPARITFAISQGNAAVINSEDGLVLIAPSGSNEAVTLQSIKWSSAGAGELIGTKLGVIHLPEGASGLGRLSFASGTTNVLLEISGRDQWKAYVLRVDNAGDAEICRPLVINGSRFLEVSQAIYRPEDVLDVLYKEGEIIRLIRGNGQPLNLVTNSIGSKVKLGLSRRGAGCLVDVVQIDGAGGAGVASFAIGGDLEPHAVSTIVPIKGLVEDLWISPDGALIVWELQTPYLRRVVTRCAEWILRVQTTRRHRFALCNRDGRLIGYLTQPEPTGRRPEILWTANSDGIWMSDQFGVTRFKISRD